MRYLKLLLIFVLLSFAMAPEMKLKRVAKDIYMVRGVDALPSVENRGFMSNAFAVLTKEGWVVIDALSTPELSKEFVDNLYRVKKAPIKYAIITHYHPDHYYGAKTYKDLGATIIAHEKLLEFYRSGDAQQTLQAQKERFKGLFDKVVLVPPDRTVKDRLTLKVGGKTFELISMTTAHTNSDLVVYMPEEKVLFAGDLLYMNRIPFMGDRNASSKGWVEALRKIRDMDIKVVLAGHNEPMGKESIDFTLGYINFLRDNIKRLKEEGKSLDEIKELLKNNPYAKYVMYDVFHNANVFKIYTELDMEE